MNRILNFAFILQKTHLYNKKMCLQNILKLNTRTICGNNNTMLQKETYVKSDAATAKKKTKPIPRITLIAQNQSMSITTLEEAQKLAKRRDLQLIKVQQMDSKTQRPVYKLISASEMLSEEMKELQANDKVKQISQNSQLKSEKTLTIGARISEHDLASRIKNIGKWLLKQHEVRIMIQGTADESAKCDNIFKTIEKSVKEPEVIGKVINKRAKASVVKFSIMPVPKTAIVNATSADKLEDRQA